MRSNPSFFLWMQPYRHGRRDIIRLLFKCMLVDAGCILLRHPLQLQQLIAHKICIKYRGKYQHTTEFIRSFWIFGSHHAHNIIHRSTRDSSAKQLMLCAGGRACVRMVFSFNLSSRLCIVNYLVANEGR